MASTPTRKDILLAFIAAADGPVDPVRIMKGLFLIAKEGNVKSDLQYEFVPYSYGPCSFRIYDDLDALVAEGLIQKRSSGARWPMYVASGSKRGAAGALPDKLSATVTKFRQYVSSRSFATLLREVYAKYPAYAKNSVFKESAR